MSDPSIPSTIPVGETAEAILAAARASGVDHLWFVSGSELTSLQEAASKAKVLGLPSPRLMTMVHEHVALSVAMGEAMITGRPSAVAAHADLGLLHFGGAIHNAFRGGYPILMISGYPATTPDLRTVPVNWLQQRWDQGEIVRQYVKWDHCMTTYDDSTGVVARALQLAMSPPAGPVYLALPPEVTRLQVDREVEVHSAQDLGITSLGSVDGGLVDEIATRILESQSPLLITDRIGRNPRAVQLLDEFATEFAVSVDATRHRMNIRDTHPGTRSTVDVSNADVILVVEHAVPWIPTYIRPRKETWVGVIGSDPAVTEVPLYEIPANLRVVAEPEVFLRDLIEACRRIRRPANAAVIEARSKTLLDLSHRARKDVARQQRNNRILSEANLASSLDRVLEPANILVWECADVGLVERTKPGTLFESGGSSLGWGMAAATGASFARPDQTVVCVCGDGSYMFGAPDSVLWTQKQHDAPVLTVIANNRGYRTGTIKLKNAYPEGYGVREIETAGGMFDPPPDFAAHARAAGCYGRKVVDGNELEAALADAKHVVEHDRTPAIVDVWLPAHVTKSHPLA